MSKSILCRLGKPHQLIASDYVNKFKQGSALQNFRLKEKMSLKTLEFIMTSNYKIVCAAPCEGIQFDGTKKIFDKEGDCVWTYLK